MADHYTANIVISKVERSGTINNPVRDAAEVVKLVVRADTLAKLRDKLASHVALIEE